MTDLLKENYDRLSKVAAVVSMPTAKLLVLGINDFFVGVARILGGLVCGRGDYWSNFRCCKGVPLFNAVVPAASPGFSSMQNWSPETRNVPLSCGAKHISIS